MADRIAGGLWGLLVGDAFGVPYEFHAPDALPPRAELSMVPPPGFARAHAGVPPGTWSDDGAHALCLLTSLLECGRLDLDDLGRRLLMWYDEGYLAVDRQVFDVGNQTALALRHLRNGVRPERAGPASEMANGNGSLMRVLPLVLWHRGSDAELAQDAARQSIVTHGHARSRVCNVLYVVWARGVLEGRADPWPGAVATTRALYALDTPERAELEFHVRPEADVQGRGSGYVVDCLRSAVQCVAEPTYEGVVRAAVALGHDTDTTACVAGGVAGLRDGVEGIPSDWLAALRGKELVEPLLVRLRAR